MRGHIRAGEVPEVIKKTSEEFAGIFFDEGRSDRFRTVGMSQKAYVRRYWTSFVDTAVAALTVLLSAPGTPEDQKLEIYEAIVAFKTVRSTVKAKPAMSLKSLN